MNNDEQLLQGQIAREVQQHELGLERFKHQLEKRKLGMDYSNSTGGRFIQKNLMEQMTEAVEAMVEKCSNGVGRNHGEVTEAINRVSNLPVIDLKTGEPIEGKFTTPWRHDQAALITFRTMLDVSVMPMFEEEKRGQRFGGAPNTYDLERLIARRIETQCILNHARTYFPDSEWHTGWVSRLLKEWYSTQASAKQKDTVTRLKMRDMSRWATQNNRGFFAQIFDYEPWSDIDTRMVGAKLMNFINQATVLEYQDDVPVTLFEYKQVGKDQFLRLSTAGKEFVEAFDDEASKRAFVVLPMLCPPRPHTREAAGGYIGVARSVIESTVSSEHKALLDLSDKHLEFLNQQQAMPLVLNQKIYGVMKEVMELTGASRNIGKFCPTPIRDEFVREIPKHLADPTGLTDEQMELRDLEKKRCAAEHRAFKKLEKKSKESMTMEALQAADICKDDERFYVPTYACFRGRTYPRGVALTFQGRDFQKALLNFADPAPVDHRTEYWMRMNMSADMGLDKLSYEARSKAIDDNLDNIIASVRDPIGCEWWKQQDNPWMLLHVAFEFVRLFVDNDAERTTRCRTSSDATCSGQQIMAGLTRSLKTATQVNLVPAEAPADVYGNVLDVAVEALKRDNFNLTYKAKRSDQPILKRKLKGLGTTDPRNRKKARKGAKSIILVGQYGAGRKTRIGDFSSDVNLSWLGKDATFSVPEATTIYPYFKEGLDECLPAMDAFLDWVQMIVRKAFEQPGRDHILIPSADGSLTKQLYRKPTGERIEMDHLGGLTLGKRRNEHSNEVGDKPDIDKHVTSTTANLVHAQDGATLVLALTDIGIPFTTCHDSISGRPGVEMDLIDQNLKQAYFKVFTSDVCRRFVELNGLEYNEETRETNYGDYDPKLVLKATYAFS